VRRGKAERSGAWTVGWAAGGGVVAIAAGLILSIIGLGRRITGQAGEIVEALDGAREHTAPLWELTATNATLERTASGLRAVREQAQGS
jgi:hypothetical protein